MFSKVWCRNYRTQMRIMKMTCWPKKSWTTTVSDQINLMRGMVTIRKMSIELLWPLINCSDGFQHVD